MDKELYNKVLAKTVNDANITLVRDYLHGNQWTVSGQITRNNFTIVETPQAGKIYQGITYNVISDAYETMKSLVIGEAEDEYAVISTSQDKEQFLKDSKFATSYLELVEDLLKYGKSSVILYRVNDSFVFDVVDGYKVWKDKRTGSIYLVDKEQENVFKSNYKITEITSTSSGTYTVKNYINDGLVSVTEYKSFPIYSFNIDEYITKDMIRQQDVINFKYTIEKNVELYNSDPLKYIAGWQPDAGQKVKTGSGQLLTFSDKDVKVGAIDGMSLPTNFIELKKEALLDFYKLAKLTAIKNSDLSGVTSGYALQLKLIETLSYVNEFRNHLKTQLLEMFQVFYKETGITDFNITELYLAPIIGEKNKEVETEEKKLGNVEKKVTLLKDLISLGYTKEEAVKYIEENKF